ncbi:hypothetical protein CCH79_00019076 [Gambusia affinis]|uniref:Uncharacterized protein n=1 Tax=Gambusia affinis TaxID=33528 RepID=A0A315W018_GAMAF|nr:hypothetical protein CCH79_00019076 [Gambusia affinis]
MDKNCKTLSAFCLLAGFVLWAEEKCIAMRTKSKLLEVKGEVSTVRSAEHLRSIKSKVGLIFHRFGSGRLPKGANKCIDYRVISAELIGPELEHRLIQTEPPQGEVTVSVTHAQG